MHAHWRQLKMAQSAILQASKTEQYGAAKHLLLMGHSLLTGDVLVIVRFGLSHGPF